MMSDDRCPVCGLPDLKGISHKNKSLFVACPGCGWPFGPNPQGHHVYILTFLGMILAGIGSILSGLLFKGLHDAAYAGGLLVISGVAGEVWTAYLWSNWKRWSKITGLEPRE
jgi:hypothetical protein